MTIKNTVFGTMLSVALLCGTVAAIPAVCSPVLFTNEASQKMMENVYVKTQNVEYTTEDGENILVSVSSNGDDSRMMMYSNIYGDRQRAILHKNEDGSYEVKDATLSEEDAMNIAQIVSENGQWREM